MELRHLRYFARVAEYLNFTKAAARLHVAQPALSRQIRDLEDELGVQLLERGPRAVRLTEAGAAYLVEACAILERAEDATKLARAVARGERGEIHVGYAPSLTVELLPCTLHAFHNQAAGVNVKLHDLSSEEMLHGLREGKLHLSLMARPSARTLGGLTFELLRKYPVCIALPPSHRLARRKSLELSEVAPELLVAYSRAEYPEYHAMLTELFGKIGATPRIGEEHSSATSLIAAAEIGRGLAIVPACLGILAGTRLKFRPLQPAPSPIQLGAVFDKQRLPVSAAKFLAAARGAASGGKVGAVPQPGGSKLGRQ